MESEYNYKKVHISGTIYYTHFVLGCVVNFISPLVIDFSHKFDTDVPTISIAFTITTVSYLVAALSGGLIFNYVNRHGCLLFLVALISTAVFLMPHVATIPLFYVLAGMIGFGAGGCDTAQITWIIETWRSRAAPFILLQHFSFSIGTMVPPLLLSPFLDQDPEESFSDNSTLVDTSTFSYSEAKVLIPFTVGGSLMALALILHLILFFRLRSRSGPYKPQFTYIHPLTEGDPLLTTKALKPSPVLPFRLSLVLLACLFIGFYQAMEVTTFQFLPTFCVYSEVALSQAAAAQIMFQLSLAFACGRGLGILLVLKIPPQFILWGNFTLLLVANLILLLWGQDTMTMLQIGVILLGSCGYSTIYPAFYAHIEKHLHITNRIVASITICGGLVSSIHPLIVGNFIEGDPSVLNYVIFSSLTVITVSFGIVHWLTREKRNILFQRI